MLHAWGDIHANFLNTYPCTYPLRFGVLNIQPYPIQTYLKCIITFNLNYILDVQWGQQTPEMHQTNCDGSSSTIADVNIFWYSVYLTLLFHVKFSVLEYRAKRKTIKSIYCIQIPGDYTEVVFSLVWVSKLMVLKCQRVSIVSCFNTRLSNCAFILRRSGILVWSTKCLSSEHFTLCDLSFLCYRYNHSICKC